MTIDVIEVKTDKGETILINIESIAYIVKDSDGKCVIRLNTPNTKPINTTNDYRYVKGKLVSDKKVSE